MKLLEHSYNYYECIVSLDGCYTLYLQSLTESSFHQSLKIDALYFQVLRMCMCGQNWTNGTSSGKSYCIRFEQGVH